MEEGNDLIGYSGECSITGLPFHLFFQQLRPLRITRSVRVCFLRRNLLLKDATENMQFVLGVAATSAEVCYAWKVQFRPQSKGQPWFISNEHK